MADRFLLQSGSGIIELQSSTDDLILQSNGGASAALDDGGDSFWGGFQSAIVTGAVIAAMALSVGNARAAASPHQDEYPYATGNGIRYSQPYTQRAQVKPVFVSWAQGDEFPQQAAPTVALDDTGFVPVTKPPEPVIWLPPSEDFTSPKLIEEEASLPFSVKGEISFQIEWPDEVIARIQVEESQWDSPFTVPQIPVAPVWNYQDENPQTPAGSIIEESEFLGASTLPVPFLTLWNAQDEITTAPPPFTPMEEDWGFSHLWKDDANGIIWVTDDDIAPAFAVEEIGWRAEWLIPKPFTEVFWTTDELPTAAVQPQGGGGVVYDEISIFRWYQEDPLPVTATLLGIDEEPWNPPVLSLEGPKWQYFPDEVIGPEAINGTSATINANDTSNASGTTTIVGSATNTNNDDTSNASGTTTIVGTSTTTNADDTSNASGSIGGAVSGDSATTNNDDTSSANGTTTIVGTSATTNENDTNSATGTTTVNGSAADTNNNDISTASGISGTPAAVTHTLPMTGAGPS